MGGGFGGLIGAGAYTRAARRGSTWRLVHDVSVDPMLPAFFVDSPRAMGAEVIGDGTRFRLFSESARTCQVHVLAPDDDGPGTVHDLHAAGDGYLETTVAAAGNGTLYEFLLDGRAVPDPYARFLPRGVHGPAMVVESTYDWRHGAGVSRPMREQVIYEIHVGTFTREGTYATAAARLPALVDLGVTALELMPLSSFPGKRGWGYDGVAHFAPYPEYGTPDELRALIDEAHGLGLSVLLDVVYNHFGPAGNYLQAFSSNYFSTETKNAWGDGPNCAHPSMRNYVLSNVRYWLTDFRFDGLRLDATHAIVDPSPTHILQEATDLAHALTPRKLVIAEDERNDADFVLRTRLDGVWADDFHHVAHVTLTHESDGYYASYRPGPESLAEAIRKGWLYEGQVYPASGKPRGKPAPALPAEAFVYCLQNHDQIGNRAFGDRLATEENLRGYAALSTLFLFLPMTPMLFMGQEWAATSPFQYFTDHDEELGRLISAGRREEFKSFRAFADPAARERIPDPQAEETFNRSKLDWEERDEGKHAEILRLYKEMVKLRRFDPVLRVASRERLTAEVRSGLLVVRRTFENEERLLIANLGEQATSADIVATELRDRSLLLRSDLVNDLRGPMPAWTAAITAGPVAR